MNIIRTHCLALATLLTITSSCSSWLEPESKVDPDRNSLLSTVAGMEDAFTGIYATLSHKDLYGRTLTYYVPSILAGHYGMVGNDIEYWMKYPYNRTTGSYDETAIITIDRIWSRLYNLIANTNSIIEYAVAYDPEESNNDICHAKGEALGLRGFLHFELLRYFGEPYTPDADTQGIPYMDSMSQSASPFLSAELTVEKIINDLEYSLVLMEDSDDKGRLRFGHTAALATLARVYIYAGNYEKAYNYAVRAMNEHSDYVSWYDPDSTSNDRLMESELIFALDVSRLDEYAAGWIVPGGAGRKNNIMVLTQAGEYYYDETEDIRYQLWVSNIGYDRYCNKFDLSATVHLMPMIRLSEMAYIAAETAPSETDGIAYLNIVRTNRGLAPLADNGSVDLDNELAKEYQREFICEGQLWHFYKRKLYKNIPGNSNFKGRTELYTFPIPEDETIFGNHSIQ